MIVIKSSNIDKKEIRALKAIVKSAETKGLIHERDGGWLNCKIENGFLRVVKKNNKIIGMFVIEEIKNPGGKSYAYGESLLWKTKESVYSDVMHKALIEEARMIGSRIYGAYYKNNKLAMRFYSKERKWNIIPIKKAPEEIVSRVCEYSSVINVIYRDL